MYIIHPIHDDVAAWIVGYSQSELINNLSLTTQRIHISAINFTVLYPLSLHGSPENAGSDIENLQGLTLQDLIMTDRMLEVTLVVGNVIENQLF